MPVLVFGIIGIMAFDFDAAVKPPFRMQPGLRKLAATAGHLTPLQPDDRHQREKVAVLSAFPELALQQRPRFDARPAIEQLALHAATEQPQAWAWDGQRAEARLLGVSLRNGQIDVARPSRFGPDAAVSRCLHQLAPEWRLAALLSLAFAEDFAIVDARDASIPWLAVALPSFWAPQEKVGRHFAEVHAPVADNSLLIQAAAALTTLVSGPQAWERFVWTITGHPQLHAHPRHVDPQRWPSKPGDDGEIFDRQAWWRTERQTFIPLPAQSMALFTIAVDVQPLAQAIDSAEKAQRLADTVSSMSAAVLEYRSLLGVREPLLRWLSRRASA